MAFLTKTYTHGLKKIGLIERNDFTILAGLSKKAGFRNGKGYTRVTFSNVINRPKEHCTTPEIIFLIINYYKEKASNIKAMDNSIKKIQNELKKTA